MVRGFCTATLAAAVIALALPARAQSLGEIAKKEQERRKAIDKPSKVLTNDDLKKPQNPLPPSQPLANATGQVPENKPAAQGDQKPAANQGQKPAESKDPKDQKDEKGEEYWHNRMSTAREELRRNQMFADALQTRINSLTNDFSARDDPYQRAQLADDRQKAISEMARVKGEIENLTKQIADIEEEARRLGVPPGWLR
jgi:DNA repair exonuclease SbcCD ATPase subunit